jgi:hypothetical protein
MAIYGQLTIVNLTNEDLKIKAHQRKRGPREFNVGAGNTVRETAIRLDTNSIPGNKKKWVEIFDKQNGNLLFKQNMQYEAVYGWELVLVCDRIEGSFKVRVVNDYIPTPTRSLTDLENEYVEGLRNLVQNGLDYESEHDD